MLLQQIYSTRNVTEAYFVRSLLDADGISATVMGDTLPDAIGAVPFGALPSVWVHPRDMERAAAILAGFKNPPAHPRPSPAQSSWKCPNCKEVIEGQFTACWHCQRLRPVDGESVEPPIAVSTDPTLQTDLSCIRCQYNLRGLTPANLCPECGLPILRSLLAVLRDGMPPAADDMEQLLSQPFQAAAITIGYPVHALMAVCRAWMRANQTLDSDGEAPINPLVIAGLTCAALRDEAISCFGDGEEAKAGLRAWAIHGSDEIGPIVCRLMNAGLIQPTASDPAEAFNGLFTLDDLFILPD